MNLATPLMGKRCVVTGGTGGIGLVTTRRLVELGADVIVVGRDKARGLAAKLALQQATGRDGVEFLQADLAEPDALRSVAETIANRWDHLDILINNAGGMFGMRQINTQGMEMTFALNHLGYFLLTGLLLPRLQAAPERSRIVNVASAAHRRVKLDFNDLQSEKSYRAGLPIAAPSWRICCLRRHWRGGLIHSGSPSMPCIPALWQPTSAFATA